MPRYGLVWLEIAREHYASLPAAACEQIDARIEQLRENSLQQPRSAYDEATDQWTITYGGGPGLACFGHVLWIIGRDSVTSLWAISVRRVRR